MAEIIKFAIFAFMAGLMLGMYLADRFPNKAPNPAADPQPKREPLTAKQVIERQSKKKDARHEPLRAKRASWQEIRAKLEVDQQQVETERRMERAFEAHKDIH